MDKPTLPKGTRDFGPAQMAKRQFIFNTIRTVFQKYGFQPLETPSMENLSTLTGKYGDEGDQLLFRILNSGEFKESIVKGFFNTTISSVPMGEVIERAISLVIERNKEKVDYDRMSISKREVEKSVLTALELCPSLNTDHKILYRVFFEGISLRINQWLKGNHERTHAQFYEERNSIAIELVNEIRARFKDKELELPSNLLKYYTTEKGLRYDLTVPFARYVVMNRGEITLPFKRYQIQPVWRADRPQKGRYREFYQCDADVVGTDSLVNEAEIVLMIHEVFKGIGITDYTIKINHRGILSGLAEISGAQNNEGALFIAIDKLDKIGEDKVKEEMKERGISETSAQQVFDILNFKGSNEQKLELLKAKFANTEKGKKGVDDLENVFKIVASFNASATNNQQPITNNVELDISLARGLSYYTGTIFEVKVNNVAIGSVSGGGRYDNLTQAFGAKERLSGVGISFGIDRLYDVLEELKLFPKEATLSSKVLVTHLDETCMVYGLGVTQSIRNQGIACEIYPEVSKIKKQLEYADRKQIPFAIVIGSEEVSSGILTLKNLTTGEQQKLKIEEIIKLLR